jgi:hypothetical protein
MRRNNEIRVNDRSIYDGLGDGGERFRIITKSLVERGWNAAEIKQEIGPVLGLCDPPRLGRQPASARIERCIAKVRPLETKPAAKAEQNLDNITCLGAEQSRKKWRSLQRRDVSWPRALTTSTQLFWKREQGKNKH